MTASIDVLVPFWGLAGGVIKILDYADHAAHLGRDVQLWAPPVPSDDQLLESLPVVRRLFDAQNVRVGLLNELDIDRSDVVLFTDPTHHELIERTCSTEIASRLLHLIQGTRHANPRWLDGRNYRLLHRPMNRISVSQQVTEAIRPLVNKRFAIHTIVEGHDIDYFSNRSRPDLPEGAVPRILYTTWKSDLGDRVRDRFERIEGAPKVAWIAVREPMGWPALRNRYHGADIFLCTPGPEEGFYLPGLEAMAAGAAVITSLVGGNAAYVQANDNAVVAEYDDVDAHVDAIMALLADRHTRATLVKNAYSTAQRHRLDRERDEFAAVLATVGT